MPESPHAGVHDVKVHIRGSYARLGDLVPRHFPAVLAGDVQPPKLQGSGRLELAQWIASPVPSADRARHGQPDLAAPFRRGHRPHAEQLRLARRAPDPSGAARLAGVGLRRARQADNPYACGWSMKRLHRLIMLSSAYQQSSDPLPPDA